MGYTRHFYKCDKGNRWSECEREETKGFFQGKECSADGSYCGFSGCIDNDHKIKLVKSLDGDSQECADFVHNWFRSVYAENVIRKDETILVKHENGYNFWKLFDSNEKEYWNITPDTQPIPGGGYAKEYIEGIKHQSF